MKMCASAQLPPRASGGGFALLLAGVFLVLGAPARARPSLPLGLSLGLAGPGGPEHGQAARAPATLLGSQIEDALAKGDSEAARKLVPKLLGQPRLPADVLLRTGIKLAEYDLYLEAANVFGRCVKDFPQLFEGYYNLSLAELALREYSEALATLAKAPSTEQPGEAARTYLRGKIETALGKKIEAERDLATAFGAAPREENYALDLGLYYIREQKYQQAQAVFQKASSFRNDSLFLQLGLALAQFLAGQSKESIETCRALLAVHPDFSPARVMMAFALYMQGRIEEAARTAAQGLLDPSPSAYLFYLHAVSLLRLQAKDYDLMLNDLTVAARDIPQCSLCYLAMSKVHQREGDWKVATADLEKAVSLDPSLAEAWYRLASLYEQAGHPEVARQARQRFETLKENKVDRETEMLRGVFVKSLGGEGRP